MADEIDKAFDASREERVELRGLEAEYQALKGVYERLGQDLADSQDLLQRVEAIDRRLARYVLAGNAGGIISTLGLIGTTFGSASAKTFPEPIFWVLIIFVMGLGASFGEVVFELFTAAQSRKLQKHESGVVSLEERDPKWFRRTQNVLLSIASG
jgi:hypothetical protein